MYERHFGLSKPPFRITPDPDFFFAGGRRGAVLEALVYAITRGEGIIKVVGEVGSGKTMLCRMLERELPAACEIVYLANPGVAAQDVARAIAQELGLAVATDGDRYAAMQALQAHLLARHAGNRRVIMFVEEAQAMPLATLEEIRLLSNLETTADKLLQIVLFGQPELDAKLDRHDIRQLRERITHSFELQPLTGAEVAEYLAARTRASGHRGDGLFTAGAVRAITRHSRGLLRRINILADKALLAAFAAQAARVEQRHVRLAARDSEFGRQAARRVPWLSALLFGLAVVILALVLGQEFLLPGPVRGQAGPTPAPPPATVLETSPAEAAPAQVIAPPPAALESSPALLPQVAPETGMVGLEHLQPLLDQAPAAAPEAQAEGGREGP